MRFDLLKLIANESEVTNAIVLTQNVDFVFVQNLVLNSLARCGSPSLTIFADASCASETFSLQAPLLSNLGKRYRVVPVTMSRGCRFHPKAVFLSGRSSARLFVGSGNLTFSGWRENGEIWVDFDSEAGTAEISAFKSYLDELVDQLAINDSLKGEVAEAFDPASREWARDLDEPRNLVGRSGRGPALFESLIEALGRAPCERLVVASPYFDDKGLVLRQLHEELGSPPTEVFLDPKHSNLRSAAVDGLPQKIELRPAWVERSDSSGRRSSFLHAKFYAAERGDEVVVLVGSANCSRAALTTTGEVGNAELMAAVRLNRAEFGALESELRFGSQADLDLTGPEDDSDEEADSGGPLLLAARAEDDVVTIAVSHPASFDARRAFLDEVGCGVRDLGDGIYECQLPHGSVPRAASLEGRWQGHSYQTPSIWVDHEKHLLSSSYRRLLDDTIRRKARKTEWDIGDWFQVLEILCQDIEYTTAGRSVFNRRKPEPEAELVFTREDLFSRSHSLRLPNRTDRSSLPSGATSLQALLLRWFDHESPVGVQPAPDDSDEMDTGDSGLGGEHEEAVDRVESLVREKLSPEEERSRAKKEERDRAKARRIVERLTASMTCPDRLSGRRLEDLGRDLQLASVLIRMGSAKGWLEQCDVLSATHAVWTSLFLSEGERAKEGWLERRRSEDPVLAQAVLAKPAVTAALFVWSLEIPSEPRTPRDVQMLLALALSVARHPWLWCAGEPAAVAEEVEGILMAASGSWSAESIASRWEKLQLLGRDLSRLEDSVSGESMQRLRELNPQEKLPAGELLWQGRLGYCILEVPALRTEEKNVEVLLLQTGTGEPETRMLRSNLLNPVRGLLGAEARGEGTEHLGEFLESLRTG